MGKYIAVLGPKGSYSDRAASVILRPDVTSWGIYYCQTISEVFEKVKNGEAEQGIVPVENLLIGPVRETLDNLIESNLIINQEIILPINLCLAGLKKAKISNIKSIISKNEALSQCSKFLRTEFPKGKLIISESTSDGIQKIIKENQNSGAVICDMDSAKKYGLKIIKKNISNLKNNKTKFILFSKTLRSEAEEAEPFSFKEKCLLTSIAFYFKKDKSGNLSSILNDFAKSNINLIKLFTIPSNRSFGNYIFYIDFMGSIKDKRVQNVLNKIKSKTSKLKLFGSFQCIKL
jgi:prephenate dehydratase